VQVDQYEIIRELGAGGMGVVYLARDRDLGRKAALKFIRTDRLTGDSAVARFALEARATARLAHPNIVAVFGVGEWRGYPYLACEYLPGESLRQRLERGPLGLAEALRITRAVAEAVAEAHAHRILHRDLKPANVFLPRDGRVRVLDFGLARVLARPEPPATPQGADTNGEHRFDTARSVHPDQLPDKLRSSFLSGSLAGERSETRGVVGTLPYLSPEQWLEDEPTPAVDTWAIGVMLWEMLAGRRPIDGNWVTIAAAVISPEPTPALEEAVPGLPGPVTRLAARCLLKDPELRPPMVRVAEQLAQLCGGRRSVDLSTDRPYRGLLPFGVHNAGSFFGRDAEVQAFRERLRTQPVVPVVGPSGAGKSSFVMAGALPPLLEQGEWRALTLRPGDQPLRTLALRIAGGGRSWLSTSSLGSDDEDWFAGSGSSREVDELRDELLASPQRAGQLLRQAAREQRCQLLVFIDQLEELFALEVGEEERRAFARALALAADDPFEPLRVVFTIRDDFLGRLAEHRELAATLDRGVVLLRTPDRAALVEILERPLEPFGFRFEEPAIVEQMVDCVAATPAGLPLLQFAAQRLWEQRDLQRRLLTRAAYEAIGGVEGALAAHADGVIDALVPEQARLARSLLLRLCTSEGTRAQVEERELVDELGEGALPVARRLLEARLLRAWRADGGPDEALVLELTHESLLTAWERLRSWRAASRQDQRVLEELRGAARTWESHGRRAIDLWGGESLEESLTWRRHYGQPLSRSVVDFLERSEREAARRAQRRRRAAFGTTVLAIAVAVTAVVVALVIARQARDVREHLASSLLSDARAALQRSAYPAARAKVRQSLEVGDSPGARALWRQLARADRELSVDVEESVLAAAWSPDGRWLATGGPIVFVRLWDVETGAERRLPSGGTTTSLAFSPDGSRLAVGGINGGIRIFDPSGTVPPLETGQAASYLNRLSFSGDGAVLAGCFKGEVWGALFWDTATGEQLTPPPGFSPRLCGAFVPGSSWYATEFGEEAFLFDEMAGEVVDPAAAGARLAPQRRRAFEILARTTASHDHRAHIDPLERFVAVARLDGGVEVWDLGDGSRASLLSDAAEPLALAPGGDRLAAMSSDGRLEVWRLAALGPEPLPSHFGRVEGLAYSPDGRLLASASWDGSVLLWDLAQGGALRLGSETGTPKARHVSFSADGRQLASAHIDGSVRVWDVGTGRLEHLWPLAIVPARWTGFHPSRDLLAATLYTARVGLFDPARGVELDPISFGGDEHLRQAAFDPTGRLLAAPGFGRVLLLDLEERVVRDAIDVGGRSLHQAAFRPGGGELVVGTGAGPVHVVDPASREVTPLEEIEERGGFAFLPDGDRIAVVGRDGRVSVLRWPDGALIRRFPERAGGPLLTVAASTDGRLLSAAGVDPTVRTWELSTGRLLRRAPLLAELGGRVVLLDHAGLHTPSTSEEGWEPLATAELPALARPGLGAAEVGARLARVSPDGGLLAFVGPDDRTELWDTRTGTRVWSDQLDGVAELEVLDDGLLVTGDPGVQRWSCGAACERTLHLESARAAAPTDDGGLWVAEGDIVRRLDAEGQQVASLTGPREAAALAVMGDDLLISYPDGTLEHREAGRGWEPTGVVFDGGPTLEARRMMAGPMGTLLVGYADGALVLWDLRDGAVLDRAKLHGPVTHLVRQGASVYAATELGDTVSWDLSELHEDYCATLRTVWDRIGIAWEDGRAVRRPPPADHACR